MHEGGRVSGSDQTENRKREHINICSTRDVRSRYNFWDDIHLVHSAAPEIDSGEVDTKTGFLGKKFSAPIIIAAMTGGFDVGEKVNASLAEAAAEMQIGMGVGSQRGALDNPLKAKTYAVIKDYDVPMRIANIGAPQIVRAGGFRQASDMLTKAIDMIDADLVAIHLNYLQEAVQPEGEKSAKGLLALIRDLATDIPIIVKETGAGLSPTLLKSLSRTKVKAVDVGGAGGTSFSAVEFYRAQESGDNLKARLGMTFWDWGIPAPVSAAMASLQLPTIATGGIRDGLDVARAIAIDASCAGMANKLLVPALEGAKAVSDELEAVIEELKVAMFLTGSKSIRELADQVPMVVGPTKEWLGHLAGV
jgi:isopentenyl-diphosphate delta-isomerase